MQISYTHKFIFIHIAKVAGLSIRAALDEYCQEPTKFKIKRPLKVIENKKNPFYEMWEVLLLHTKARDIKKELTPEVYNSYFTFAFVRNPWDWQVSMYHFILKEKDHIRHKLVKSMSSFQEYLEWVMAARNPYARGAVKFQKDMIIDSDGRIIVDFIGRFETLAEDFQQVGRTIGIPVSLPYINRSNHRDYKSYYNEETRRMVAQYFEEDIQLLGYTFDGHNGRLKLGKMGFLPQTADTGGKEQHIRV